MKPAWLAHPAHARVGPFKNPLFLFLISYHVLLANSACKARYGPGQTTPTNRMLLSILIMAGYIYIKKYRRGTKLDITARSKSADMFCKTLLSTHKKKNARSSPLKKKTHAPLSIRKKKTSLRKKWPDHH